MVAQVQSNSIPSSQIKPARRETYSSPLVNYIEPYNIHGVDYTRFYTELNTGLKIDDYVYILNGNYDNSNLIDQNEYQKGTTGYKILMIDKNSIVLDIPYRTEKPFNEDDFQDYTKVYLVDTINKFNYENIDNGFGFDIFTGEKYSTLNNNVFLSQIENMNYTSEIQTKDKFFKSNAFEGHQIESSQLRGQLINDATFLNWELEETSLYGLTPSGTGSSIISFSAGRNYVKDFDLITNTSSDKIVALISPNLLSNSTIWTWDKKTRKVFEVEIKNSTTYNFTQVNANYIKPFETGNNTLFPNKNIIRIKCPANLNGTYSFSGYTMGSTSSSTTNGVNLLEYDVEGFSQAIVLGYSGATSSNNYRSFGFYNNNYATSSYMVPSPDNMLSVSGTKELAIPYAVTGGTYTTPFFVLSDRGTYSNSMYFPVNTNGSRFNIVPEYAEFSGIGNPSRVEINDWVDINDKSQNLEYCFAGDLEIGGSGPLSGGLYFYSYAGNHKNIDTNKKHIGNAFELSKKTYDKYKTGIWSGIYPELNPFHTVSNPIGFLNNIKDVKWVGIEKKNPIWLNLTTTNNGKTVVTNSSNGIYYTKYLVITSVTNIPNYYIYLNYNYDLLRYNEKFEANVISERCPQVHCYIEEIVTSDVDAYIDSTVVGSSRTNIGDIYPYILDSKYVIGQLSGGEVYKYSINETFDSFDFDNTSVTSVNYNDQRWIIGAGNSSPRVTTPIFTSSSRGIYVYDTSVSINVKNINIGTTFSVGDNLPSNNVFKVRGEVIDGHRRVWAATENGIFMFDSNQSFNSDYYYSIDLDNNELPLDTSLYKNNRLYIMEDFIYDGIIYKKGDICKWLNSEKRWEVDVTYLKPYLTKAHFEDGSFLPYGILDDGIFGNRDSVANWLGNGSKWRNGILYNSNWIDGIMQSKSDELVSQSYYSITKSDRISNTTDFTNNNTYGYNMSIKSNILGGTINNGNFYECVIGDINIDGLLDYSFGGSSSFTYSNLMVNQGYFLHSDIYSTIINKSKVESSDFNSSTITNNSRIINSNSLDSIIDNATIENKGKIKIIGYDKWYNIKRDLVGSDIIHIHKFFIDKKDFNELEFGNSVIFNNVITDSGNITDVLNNIFYVIGGTYGYYMDTYEDLNRVSINGNSVEYTKNEFKLFISKRIKTQNTIKSAAKFNGVDLSVVGVTNENPQYSIDLSIVVGNIPHGSDPEIYLNAIKNDGVLKFNVIDISPSTIQTDHFDHSWINGGEWLNGSIISPNQTSHKFNTGTMSIIDDYGNNMIKMYMNDTGYELKLDSIFPIGSNVTVENIWDNGFTTYVGGDFKILDIVTSGSQSYIVLNPYDIISLTASTILTQPISQYKFINSNKINGANNTLTIKKGLFKNQSFSDLEFNDNSLNVSYSNIIDKERDLMIVNSEITNINNVDISNGLFIHGQLSTDFGTSSNMNGKLNSYKQVFNYFDINGGKIEKSTFLNGNFNNGTFLNNKYEKDDDLIPINNNNLLTDKTAILPVWMSGSFNNGIFDKSIWMGGGFNNGKFLNSEFLGGTFSNGIFGDKSSKPTLNAFRKGIFENGIFENGIFGDNSLRINDINSIYGTTSYIIYGMEYIKDGTNIWMDGNFNDGIFTTIDNNVSMWMNGNFNNGQILDSVIWYDGIFNNGKFKSVYGRHVSNIVGESNLLTIASSSVVSPTSSEYGSRAVNLLNYYTTDLDYLNQFNITTIRDKYLDNIFDNPGTIVLDRSDNQLKYTFVSNTHTSIVNTFDDDNSAHGYGELLLESFYGATPSPSIDLNLQFKSIDYLMSDTSRRNPLYNSKTMGSKILIQDTGNEFIYDGGQYITASNFLQSIIPNTSFTYSNIYAWRGGVFNNGEFGDSENSDNANPSWSDGIFNGGKFYGKVWKNGTFIRGNFNGSGGLQDSKDINNIFKGYNPQDTIEKYLTDFSNISIGTYSASQNNYKIVLDNWKWFGIWLNGQVLSNINELNSSDRISENVLVEYFKRDKFKRAKPTSSNFNNILWVDGNFNNNDANFNESVWLRGSFNNGGFNDSMFNPYVQRWDFESGNLSNIKFSFELDTTLCVWNNGIFNSGVFYYSDWNNGTFEHGTMVGGKFMKGISNYMSAFSSIWAGGRFRNGNWYGSNFTINNKYNASSVPNPFEYLGNYFNGVSYPPFITDILSNNADRLQDDRLHIWNIVDGTSSNSYFDLTGHDFGLDGYFIVQEKGSGNNADKGSGSTSSDNIPEKPTSTAIEVRLEDLSSPTNYINGIFKLLFKVAVSELGKKGVSYISTPSIPNSPKAKLYYDFNLTLTDVMKFTNGIYTIEYYTILSIINGTIWKKFTKLDYMRFVMTADKYVINEFGVSVFKESVDIIDITSDQISNVKATFGVDIDEEYILKVNFLGGVTQKSPGDGLKLPGIPLPLPGEDDFTANIFMKVLSSVNNVTYTDDNNTLHGYIEPIYDTNYLSSTISTITGTLSYAGNGSSEEVLNYNSYDIATISVPTNFPFVNGAYAQYGNGSFLEGIWENGVWNNGYRGTEFGTVIIEDTTTLDQGYTYDTFTYGSGATSSVLRNSLYTNTTVYQWRTSPTIYFNKVQRSFKISANKWRFVLESAFNIHANSIFTYNKLSIGDRISVGNIIALDINGNRKLIKDLFTVVDLQTSNLGQNRITIEYKETFPIDDIQIDSDRHLIYVQKNVWLYGSFLNGYFEGIMNGGYIRGNREITKFIDSHLIDVKFRGGRLMGSKYTMDSAFDNKSTTAQSLSPQFVTNYNNLYHSTVVQNMDFNDDMTPLKYNMTSVIGITISGVSSNGGEKSITYNSLGASSSSVQYLYNSDIDVVYEPEYFSSLYNQTIFNNNIIKKGAIGRNTSTNMYNIPAGYITYDILSSNSQFSYSNSPIIYDEQKYYLNLGSKYSPYNTLNNVDFNKPTQKVIIDTFSVSVDSNTIDTIPNTFNIVKSKTHDIYNRWFSGYLNSTYSDGITFKAPISFDIHENFAYIFGTSSDGIQVLSNSLIVANNDFKTRGRYHIVEVDVEFPDNKIVVNPYNILTEFTFDIGYSYSVSQLPKLTIGQGYNELYEHGVYDVKGTRGYLSPYDNDFIPYFDGRKLSEINGFTSSNRLTLKTFMYNNFGGYRDNVKIFEKGFNLDTGNTASSPTVHSPIYYSFKHYEIDQIPFFRYQDFIDPLTGTVSEWNIINQGGANQDQTRKIDSRVKVPFYATSVPIQYDNDNFILTENINFFGGTNINNNLVIDIDIYNIINKIVT